MVELLLYFVTFIKLLDLYYYCCHEGHLAFKNTATVIDKDFLRDFEPLANQGTGIEGKPEKWWLRHMQANCHIDVT